MARIAFRSGNRSKRPSPISTRRGIWLVIFKATKHAAQQIYSIAWTQWTAWRSPKNSMRPQPRKSKRLKILIEVHLGGEETKSGVPEADLPALAESIAQLQNLDLLGLMTIPPYFDEPEQVRPYFRRLRELRDQVGTQLKSPLMVLSMGMSHDFEIASRGRRNRNSRRHGPFWRAQQESVIEVSERDGSIVFAVRVTPRTSRDAIEGEYQGALKIRLTAPPVEDRANDALRRLLAARLNVPVSAVRIVSGEKSRNKRVAVAGVTRAQVISLATVAKTKSS